jgi:hypothetical protein
MENNFQPTFKKYADMTPGEQATFRQGAKTSENKVKERLGFIRPREQAAPTPAPQAPTPPAKKGKNKK